MDSLQTNIRLLQTKGETFVFWSYRDMSIFYLRLFFFGKLQKTLNGIAVSTTNCLKYNKIYSEKIVLIFLN